MSSITGYSEPILGLAGGIGNNVWNDQSESSDLDDLQEELSLSGELTPSSTEHEIRGYQPESSDWDDSEEDFFPSIGSTSSSEGERALPQTFGEALAFESERVTPNWSRKTVRWQNSHPDRIQVGNKIGNGQFGVVYRATTPEGEKVVKYNFKLNEETVSYLRRNPNLVSQSSVPGEIYGMTIAHPNVLRTEGIITSNEEGNRYLTLENLDIYQVIDQAAGSELRMTVTSFVNGGDATRFLDPANPIGDLLIPVLDQAAEGISHLHEKGFIHNDIKPDNILIDQQGNVKIADLGFLQLHGGDKHVTGGTCAQGYAAPERYVRGGLRDQKADAFAFGITACEIALGKRITDEETKEDWQGEMRRLADGFSDESYLEIILSPEDEEKLDREYPGLRPLLNELTVVNPFKRISVEQFRERLRQQVIRH